jgi:tetratricopeptide (TPR) repeat protein
VKQIQYILFCAVALLFSELNPVALAQNGNPKTMVTRADALYEQRQYEQAAGYYTRLSEMFPDNVVYQYRAGVCAIYTGDPKLALQKIKGAYEKDPTIPDVNFFLGRAYLLNGLYDEALVQFNLQLAKEPDEIQRMRLDQYVINCGAAKDLATKPSNNKVENAGRPINTPGEEYAPVMIKGDSVLYYTYKGPNSKGGKHYTYGRNDSAGMYYEDVFMTNKTSTGWFYPGSVSDNINSNGHDATSTISPDGKQLFIYKGSGENGGDIYVANKAGTDWTTPSRIPGDVNRSDSWEGSVAITPDGRTMYFVSDRLGGFGGKDIYRANGLATLHGATSRILART